MQQELLHIQKKVGTTFVHVTHDQEEAMSVADVVAVMNNGQLEDVGPPAQGLHETQNSVYGYLYG